MRDIQKILNQTKPTGYTTVLKLLQIMTEKGHVDRDESQRPQVYRARYSQQQTQTQLVRDLLQRAFGGSAKNLLLGALSAHKVSRDELAELKKFLEDYEKGTR